MKTGGHADGLGAALEGRLRVVDGIRKRSAKGTKPAFLLPGGGELEESLLRALDLLGGAVVEILPKRVVDDVLTQCDQFAAEIKIADSTTIIFRIDNRYCRIGQLNQVLCAADFSKGPILV